MVQRQQRKVERWELKNKRETLEETITNISCLALVAMQPLLILLAVIINQLKTFSLVKLHQIR